MAERTARRTREWVRWSLLGAAVVTLVVFLLAQRTQGIDVSYGRSPSPSDAGQQSDEDAESDETGARGESSLPSVEEMTAMVAADPVVRLPGAVARWDERDVAEAIGDADIRIIVAPPGLDEDERSQVREVENATIAIFGTKITGDGYVVVADRLSGWRTQFGTADVTGRLITLITEVAEREEPEPETTPEFRWREPSGAELDTVAADLRADGVHVADGATLERVPERPSETAFPDEDALYVALPTQDIGEPIARYGPALTRLFPDRPVVVLYGSWIEYDGPNATDFAELVSTMFYSRFDERLSVDGYPQANVLGVWLNHVTDVRYAGLFDRPLPYEPPDPLTVTLPALPWLFAACVVGFVVLSLRPLSRHNTARTPGPRARLAGLTALAIEVSGLTDERSDPALTRGIGKLDAARDALDSDLPARQVRALLDDAESELDDTARLLGRTDYRPRNYLEGGLG
ncbi:hypothetical protein [Prauserella cavernicola]|uniref:DUF4350 domain-containing protein n=1 Tax=Prauserella cavernicola TaxID=2800127 RepID=A0A934QPA2_9PSEU|nr:hypothetical protein [Prauserella cavernicola]MBK1783586.1 hypothetical protein [Prauserella cavernicola]